METEAISIKDILLVEDDPQDVELTRDALEEQDLANKVAVVENGAETLDDPYHRGQCKMWSWGHSLSGGLSVVAGFICSSPSEKDFTGQTQTI